MQGAWASSSGINWCLTALNLLLGTGACCWALSARSQTSQLSHDALFSLRFDFTGQSAVLDSC